MNVMSPLEGPSTVSHMRDSPARFRFSKPPLREQR